MDELGRLVQQLARLVESIARHQEDSAQTEHFEVLCANLKTYQAGLLTLGKHAPQWADQKVNRFVASLIPHVQNTLTHCATLHSDAKNPFWQDSVQTRNLFAHGKGYRDVFLGEAIDVLKSLPLQGGYLSNESNKWIDVRIEGEPSDIRLCIHSLTCQGMRGFSRDQTVTFAIPNGRRGSGLTVIVGPNGGGKSTILDVLSIAKHPDRWKFHADEEHAEAATTGIAIAVTIAEQSTVGMEVLRKLPAQILEKEAGDGELQGSSIRGLEAAAFLQDAGIPQAGELNSNWTNHFKAYDSPVARFRRLLEASAISPALYANLVHDQAVREPNIQRKYEGTTITAPNWPTLLATALQVPALEKNLISVLRQIAGPNLSVKSSRQSKRNASAALEFQTGLTRHHISTMGSGRNASLSLALLLSNLTSESIIVMDEPEKSLHPAAQRRLLDVLLEVSRDHQVIVATHSAALVSWKAFENGGEIIRCVTDTNLGPVGVNPSTRVRQLSNMARELVAQLRRNALQPHALGMDATEFLFKEKGVVLVEGQEDVVCFTTYLSGEWAPEGDFKSIEFLGWGCGGADNIPNYIKLAKEVGFQRIGVIVDGDKPDRLQELERDGVRVFRIPAYDVRKSERHFKAEAKKVARALNRKLGEQLPDRKQLEAAILESFLPKVRAGIELCAFESLGVPNPKCKQALDEMLKDLRDHLNGK